MVLKMSLSSLYVPPRTEETMSILLTKNCFLGARAFAMAPRCESAPAVCRHLLNAFSTMKMSVHITNNSNNIFCDLKNHVCFRESRPGPTCHRSNEFQVRIPIMSVSSLSFPACWLFLRSNSL